MQPDIPTGNILTLWVDLVPYFVQSFGDYPYISPYVLGICFFFSILFSM